VLADVFIKNTKIETLLLNNCLNTSSLKIVSRGFQIFKELKIIGLVKNKITEEGVDHLIPVIVRNKSLQDIMINDNDLQDMGVIKLVKLYRNFRL